jgi:hypothetical protein
MRLVGNGQRSCRGSGPGARRPITADLVRCRLVAERAVKAQTTIHAVYLGRFWPMNGCPAMTLPPVSPELAARLANYNIDDRARAVLQGLARRWPIRRHARPRKSRSGRRDPGRDPRCGGRGRLDRAQHPRVDGGGHRDLGRGRAAGDDDAGHHRQHPEGGGQYRAGLDRNPVGRAAQEGATAVGEISGWTTRLSACVQDLENKLARFFSRVRAA